MREEWLKLFQYINFYVRFIRITTTIRGNIKCSRQWNQLLLNDNSATDESGSNKRGRSYRWKQRDLAADISLNSITSHGRQTSGFRFVYRWERPCSCLWDQKTCLAFATDTVTGDSVTHRLYKYLSLCSKSLFRKACHM